MVELGSAARLEDRLAPHRQSGAATGRALEAIGRLDLGAAQRHMLLLRFALVNSAGLAMLGAAYFQGWIDTAWQADITYLSHGIFGLFVAGLALCTAKVYQTSQELNKAREYDPFRPRPSLALRYISQVHGRAGDSRAIAASALRLKLSAQIGVIRFIANALVLLGLIGTVIGFIMALAGVNPETSSDASSIGPMVSTLIAGMSVALFTTLIGSVLNIWLMVNYQILATGTVNLLATVVELGETHGRG